MYVHDIHVLYYFFIGLLGIFVGQFLDYANSRLANHKKIFCKELFKQYIPNLKINSKIIFLYISTNRNIFLKILPINQMKNIFNHS